MVSHTCSAQAAPHQAVLTWGASSTPSATYKVLRSNVPGGPYTTIKTGVTALTYTDANLAPATKFCYVIVAQAAGFLDADPSNEQCGTSGQDKAGSASGLAVIVQ